ncbi:helix-turn-helix transcriptional regulator [Nocardioides limicola]|uniref:helix-turn-helix transcriptional regulator n=1 Tax=Nocardioides limicola TaxID=2803368 RepID=UPI00193B0B51|nr:WYL domain-containing protein [Nocardioides sp. DJM-14]
MGRSTVDRVGRLDALKALLAERDSVTAADLARELDVSIRTIGRDLVALRSLGVPIEGDRGAGGGLRLEQGWSLGRVHLTESEAIGMLLSLAIAEKVGSPLLLGDIRSITRKVQAAFAPAQARRIRTLRNRILIGDAAAGPAPSDHQKAADSITDHTLQGFAQQRLLQIHYRDRAGTSTDRRIEPHYLFYSLPVWYVLAWDHLRVGARAFRLDRITAVEVLDDRFRLRPAKHFMTDGTPTARLL